MSLEIENEELTSNNSQYFGRVDKNKKKGSGELTLANTDKYVGKFNNDYSIEKECILSLMKIYMKVILKMGCWEE